MEQPICVQIGTSGLFVPRNGPRAIKKLAGGVLVDASLADVQAVTGVPTWTYFYSGPDATRYVTVPIGTGNISGTDVDYNVDTETLWFSGAYKPPKFIDANNGISFLWDSTTQKITITNGGTYLGSEFGSRVIDPVTHLGHFEWTHRDVLWFNGTADIQTLTFPESQWFGDLATFFDTGSGLLTEETAFIELEIVAFTRGPSGGFARFRAVHGALIRKGQSGAGTDWEIDENLVEITAQHVDDGLTPGTVSPVILLTGTHNGTLNFRFVSVFGTAALGPTIIKIRILGGAKYAP